MEVCIVTCPEPKKDGILLEEFLNSGNEAAFEQLVRRHSHFVLAVCRRVLGKPEDAEDATQAVFLTLAYKARGLRGRDSVAGWLHHVATNVALRARRSAIVRQLREGEARKKVSVDPEARDLKTEIDQELDALPEKYRLPLVLHHIEGCTESETAELLGCNTGAVSKRLHEARCKLRERLRRHGVPVSIGVMAAAVSGNAGAVTVPGGFVAATAKMSAFTHAGKAVAGKAIPVQVLTLAKGAVKTMFWTKLKTAAVVLITATLATSGGGLIAFHSSSKSAPASQEEFTTLQRLIKPQPEESKWASIPWLTNLADARIRAVAQDKPLFLWRAGGGDVLGRA